MSTLPVVRPQSPFPDCALVRHQVGRKVQFSRWNHKRRFIEIVAGEVLSHENRTVTVLTPWGEEVFTSCGHVTEAFTGEVSSMAYSYALMTADRDALVEKVQQVSVELDYQRERAERAEARLQEIEDDEAARTEIPEGNAPYNIADTCCGKCIGPCYVDQITGA